MSESKRIKTALVSVYHKDGLDAIIRRLAEEGVEFLSTGGTRQFIESLGYPCKAVEDLTSYPSILGGRVKTLHPKVFGGILCRRELEQDQQQIAQYEIPEIDLVIVDLYPFEATVASGAEAQAIIEKIDIGGISLIRAAAKNFNDVVIVASKAQYKPFLDIITENGAVTTREECRWFAKEAFAVSSHYDSAIFNWFDGGEHSAFRCAVEEPKTLRYGENPHQKGIFYGDLSAMFDQIHGKEISYNNLLDINAAVDLIDEFKGETTFATLARLYSEDPGSARMGGEMDYIGRGMLDPAFANVAFNLTDPKKISKIVESEFGYHIIQLIDKRGDKIKCRHILLKPKVSQEAIDKSIGRLDSIGNDIRAKKFTFEAAVEALSDDKDTRNNKGLMANTAQADNRTSKFQMKDLPTEVARVVDTMKVGQISAPFTMVNSKGKTTCALIKLVSRVEGHRATITEDFQVMKDVVLAKEREKTLHDWVVDKIKKTYVRMNDRYKNCNFEYQGWVK